MPKKLRFPIKLPIKKLRFPILSKKTQLLNLHISKEILPLSYHKTPQKKRLLRVEQTPYLGLSVY